MIKLPRGLVHRGKRQGLTGRAIALAAVLILLAVVLAPPAHRYLAARNSLSQAEHQRQDDQKQLADLKRQLAQWDDPAYIEAQARSRLQYAMPGDTVYIVIGPGHKTGLDDGAANQQVAQPPTWNQKLWQSVQVASQ